jgi:hypothetical protein
MSPQSQTYSGAIDEANASATIRSAHSETPKQAADNSSVENDSNDDDDDDGDGDHGATTAPLMNDDPLVYMATFCKTWYLS